MGQSPDPCAFSVLMNPVLVFPESRSDKVPKNRVNRRSLSVGQFCHQVLHSCTARNVYAPKSTRQ
jgi:hypothetical protein